MAIVPNLNQVPISGVTPLSDPHNASKWELTYNNSVQIVDSSPTSLVTGNQMLLPANPNRRFLAIYSPVGNANMAISLKPLTAVDMAGAVPLYGGGGYEFNDRKATNAIYLWGVAGDFITVWTA